MAIPKVTEQNIIEALKYIDETGVPAQNQSTKYELVTDDGKKYPPKYVIAVAAYIATGSKLTKDVQIIPHGYNAQAAKSYLQARGFSIVSKQEKYELVISSENVTSTDDRFTMDNLSLGDNYKPLGACFKRANGEEITREYGKGERRNSNQTLPRIACQLYEKQLSSLSVEDKENFPVCKYNPSSEMIRGIYPSIESFKKYRNTIEYLTYNYDNGRQFVIYCWNMFSTIIFVQECLKRFGAPGDQFVLVYREKDDDEETSASENEADTQGGLAQRVKRYQNPYSSMLVESKNIIFRGAPGTGKSYLAKEIAADIISDGYYNDYLKLTPEQKEQVEFVQFHPSYDYSDFVEGLRPKVNDDGSMGFDLQDGIFKRFIARARKNYEDSQKSMEMIEQEFLAQDAIDSFLSDIELGENQFETTKGSKFIITDVDEKYIRISIPDNKSVDKLRLSIDEIKHMIESGRTFEKISDVTAFIGIKNAQQRFSYNLVLYREIMEKKKKLARPVTKLTEQKKYIFIIDEINRGEISKIFGELFFSIDPGYRGRAGEVSTQYSNLHSDPNDKFFIPENVYIIGTMNDIDRSVDSFDFAMRRRFRFVELKADERLEMLASLEDEELEAEAIKRMSALNKEIADTEDLNENYQIGAAYFLKLKTLSFDQLWTDYLEPLLQEYIHGMYDEEGIMKRFAKAYGYQKTIDGGADEGSKD